MSVSSLGIFSQIYLKKTLSLYQRTQKVATKLTGPVIKHLPKGSLAKDKTVDSMYVMGMYYVAEANLSMMGKMSIHHC